MSQVICSSCFEVEDTTKRFIELPYVCALCEKDPARGLDPDQQAAKEVHGLYIDEYDIPCDAATYYVVEARSKLNKSYSWFRSQNADTKGIFDDYSTALEAAEREQDGSRIEYRVVEYRPEPTSCDTPYNSGVPCQSALDNVQEQYLDPYCVGETDPRAHAMHSDDVLNQFDQDTELIDALRIQLEAANSNVQILEEAIEDLETQLTDLRFDVCAAVFGKAKRKN